MNNTPDNNTNIPAGSNKRSSPLLKVLPIAVLAAVLVYFAAQVYNYFADPMTITLVYKAQAEDVISMEGWLVRTEEPLPGQAGTVSRAVQEGQRVAAGETVATVYSDDSALQTVSRIETLELQLQQLQFALTSYLDPDAALKLDTSITGDILTLRQTLSAGDYAAAESDLAALKAAVLKRDHGSYTSQEDIQAQIKSVESEIQQQKAALSGAKTVTAKASGTYSAVCDGYESVLTEAFLEDVTPSKLNGVKAAAEQSNVGKLIYGDTWYYAVVLPAEQAAALEVLCTRRAARETLQYLCGSWSFLDFELAVGPGVLCPRADTEVVAQAAAETLAGIESPRVLDLCAGTGCLGLGVKRLCPAAVVTCVEKSPEAFVYLEKNCRCALKGQGGQTEDLLEPTAFEQTDAPAFDWGPALNPLRAKAKPAYAVQPVEGDLFTYWQGLPEGQLDLIVSNPPYLTAEEMRHLQPEVAQEPAMALEAGEDGLVFYRALAEHYQNALRPGGALVLEIGWQQRQAVAALLAANGWADIECRKDFGGNDRCMIAHRPEK